MTAREVTILYVEDNPRDVELTLRALRAHHLANDVVHVWDGQKALQWLFGTDANGDNAHEPPRFVLIELKLPEVDGLEVLRAMRSNERTRLVPVVVMTSSHEERDLVESYKLGVNSYIVKPVDFDNFSKAVAETGHYWLVLNEHPRRLAGSSHGPGAGRRPESAVPMQ